MNRTSRFPTIVVASDLGPGGTEALRRAHALAPARLIVCHALPGSIAADPLFPQLYAAVAVRVAESRVWVAEQLHRQIADATGRLPDQYEIVCESGRPHAVIVRVASEQHADLVVVGSVDHTGLARRLLGGVAERVVRGAHCPVLVARRPVPQGAIVAATDLSDAALPAVHAAAAEAEATGARLTTIYCIDILPAYAEPSVVGGMAYVPVDLLTEGRRDAERHLDEALTREKIAGARAVEIGIPEDAIVRLARELSADLVVVGTHGRGALSRFVLGSTAEAVLREAPCSVLVVRLADAR